MKKLVKACVLSALALAMVSVPMMKNLPSAKVQAIELLGKTNFNIDKETRTLMITGKGNLDWDSIDWNTYKGKVDKVIIGDQFTSITGVIVYPLVEAEIKAVVIPDSVTSIDAAFEKYVSYTYFLYSDQNLAAQKAFPQNNRYDILSLGETWARFGYRSIKEIYEGSITKTYGLRSICGKKFFVTKNGLANGWVTDGKDLYFIYYEGMFVQNETIELEYVIENGKECKGTFTFDENGKVISKIPNTIWAATADSLKPVPIYFEEVDRSKNGLIKEGENTYFYKDGKKQSGMQIINDKKYFFDEAGVMEKSGWFFDGSNMYYLNDNGAAVVNCWRLWDGNYFYLGSDGKMKSDGWLKDYGNWYYLNYEGRLTSQWAKLNGKWYWFGGSGKMMSNGWLKLKDGKWYYFDASGAMVSNRWVKSGNKWYYLTDSGAMAVNTRIGKYRVDKNGAWVK